MPSLELIDCVWYGNMSAGTGTPSMLGHSSSQDARGRSVAQSATVDAGLLHSVYSIILKLPAALGLREGDESPGVLSGGASDSLLLL